MRLPIRVCLGTPSLVLFMSIAASGDALAQKRIECEAAKGREPAAAYDVVGVRKHNGGVLLAVLGCLDYQGLHFRRWGSKNIWRTKAFEVTLPEQATLRLEANGRVLRVIDSTVVQRIDLTTEPPLSLGTVPREAEGPSPTGAESFRAAVGADVITLEHASTLVDALQTENTGLEASLPWTFTRVTVESTVYFPALLLAQREEIWPGPTSTLPELWNSLTTDDRTRKQADRVGRDEDKSANLLLERYRQQTRSAAGNRGCVIYERTRSLQGTWLIEYWLYFPFDIGGLQGHLHDSEHVFVEVEKLGGYVRRIVGAGHGYLAGNNIYDSARQESAPARLPLAAFVENGKHATAPDVDGNGVFTPGIDENWYSERAKIWGVRDIIGTINNQFLSYDSTMTLPRTTRPLGLKAWRDPAYAWLFDESRTDMRPTPVCTLARFPARPAAGPAACKTTAGLRSETCALEKLAGHPDALNPQAALKDWNFPIIVLRGFYAMGPAEEMQSAGATLAVELAEVPGISDFKLPGRLAADFGWWSRNHTTSIDADDPDELRSDGDGEMWGLRYEHFSSNLFGLFVGFNRYIGTTDTFVNGAPTNSVDENAGMWWKAGVFAELPLPRKLPLAENATVHLGASFRQDGTLRVEGRLSFGIWDFFRRSHYGRHPDDAGR